MAMCGRHSVTNTESQLEKFFAMSLRGGLSFLLSLGFGMVSLALLASIIPPFWSGRLTITALGVGVSIGLAVFISWFKPESTRGVIATAFILAFGLAICGSFAGYLYAGIYDVQVRNTMLIGRGSAESSAIWTFAIAGSTILATGICGAYYAFRLFRYHEV